MAKVLIIDDEKLVRISLSERIKMTGHEAITASNLQEGMECLDKAAVDVVFLDINLPDGNGLESLPEIRQSPSSPEVIIITAVGSVSGADTAIRNGAWDYVTKPFDKNKIRLLVERAVDYRMAKQKQVAPRVMDTVGIIGKNQGIIDCLSLVSDCAASDANVLIQGETGTGKELFARAIHINHTTIKGEYVVVDCSAMPETLAESVLFGHVKGAFTGADKASDGLVKQADKGTLFLDEIGELPLSLQKKFLRVLQEKRFRPVGSSREVTSRFRLVSATNRDLDEMVKQGSFRQDLMHRLRTVSIHLPPLRERREDIRILAHHYIHQFCKGISKKPKALLPETLEMLEAYPWPGNVRELVNTLEKAVITEPDQPILYPMFLPHRIRLHYAEQRLGAGTGNGGGRGTRREEYASDPILSELYGSDSFPSLKSFREESMGKLESIYLKSLLARNNWDMDDTIAVAGVKKSQLYALIKKYGLIKPN